MIKIVWLDVSLAIFLSFSNIQDHVTEVIGFIVWLVSLAFSLSLSIIQCSLLLSHGPS